MVYIIWDTKDGVQVGGQYTSRNRARNRVDALDNAYGAYRYQVRVVEAK